MRQVLIFVFTLFSAAVAFAEQVTFNVDILYFKGVGESTNPVTVSELGHSFCRDRGYYGANMVFMRSKQLGNKGEHELSVTRIDCGRFDSDLSEPAKESLSELKNLKGPLFGPYDSKTERRQQDGQ